jgi:4-aminobutyrate aminotransferase-like enzyme
MDGLTGQSLEDAYVDAVRSAIQALEEQGIGCAGILMCPIFANEGLPSTPPGYLDRVAGLVHAAGGFVIFDEVQSGFGRTGAMWGQDYVGVVPDIVTMGKPMGNGHPVGGVVARADIVDAFRERVVYFNTFGGNPVSSAAGLAVLSVIEDERLLDNVRQVGAYIEDGLQRLRQRHDLIGDVRARGLFFGVELVLDKTSKIPATAQCKRLVNLVKDNGILISRIGPLDNVLKIRPPLPFGRDHADTLLGVLDHCLAAL